MLHLYFDLLPNMLDADGTGLVQLLCVFLPCEQEVLEFVDFIGQIELFRTCIVNWPGVKTNTRLKSGSDERIHPIRWWPGL